MSFKKRIETLKASTKSAAAIAICNEALGKYSEYNHFNLSTEMFEKFERGIAETVKSKLKDVSDPSVNEFIVVENYIANINNLGVKDTLDTLKNSDLAKDPTTLYMLESIFMYKDKPEWSSINFVIEKLKPLKWNQVVEQCLNVLTENSEKYAIDIKVYSALAECARVKTDYFISESENFIYNYLIYKSESNKQLVLEQLEKYTYEPSIKYLYDVIANSDRKVPVNEAVSVIESVPTKKTLKQTEFKSKIEKLISTTKSLEAIDICNEALNAYNEYGYLGSDNQAFEKFELSVSQYLLEQLSTIQETAVIDFINSETRINAIKDLGVKRAIALLGESELMKHPSTMYLIGSLKQYNELPEFLSIEPVLEKIKGLNWHHVVKEHINILEANFKTYAEDIQIYKTLHEAKNANSGFILNVLKTDLDEYLTHRTATNRAKLLEKLQKFTYDGNLRNLYNVILESDKSFQIKANSNDVAIDKVYSPVIITESTEIFAIRGKGFIKEGNKIRPLTEGENKQLPNDFVEVSKILSSPNVTISDGSVTIYNHKNKVVVNESESGDITIQMGDKSVTIDEFKQVYLKSGLFGSSDLATIQTVNTIVENWNSIFELDYVKTFTPKYATNRKMDVFKLGYEIFINRQDSLMNEDIFYPNCNATQARHMVMEYTNYDLANTFTEMLSEETKYIKQFETRRAELSDIIGKLQSKKSQLLSIEDIEIRESAEVKDLITILNDEITKVKEEYANINRNFKNFTQVQEGFGIGDNVELLKKRG